MTTIRNPIEWSLDQIRGAAHHADAVGHALHGEDTPDRTAPPVIRRMEPAELGAVLARGVQDFKANRSDVIFLCLIYPAAGLVLAHLAFNYELLPLLFPLVSGFALLGPVVAIGLYEMSRRRERGEEVTWATAFGVVRSPAFGAIFILGLVLLAIFLVWLGVAQAIYAMTLGPEPPASLAVFVQAVFTTGAGWTMIVVGCGVGFLFALLVLCISVVSFPLLLDRDVGIGKAVLTSVQAVRANPATMLTWGAIVAGGLVLGSIPLLLGLIVVLPVLGHATWHLYRRAVV